MELFDGNKAKQILQSSKIGLWRVEFEKGNEPRFYADEVMDELLGIPAETSPVDRFKIHHTYIHPDDLLMFEEYSDKLAEDRTEVVYRYIHPERGELYVRCAGVRDLTTTGFYGFYGTHQDISDTIRFEKNKTAETRLAEAVSEREAALQQAKRASAAKSDFLSRMSHDIRTPLNGIIGIMDINEAHKDDYELVNRNRQKAKRAAQHLLSLINDVLDMSKLEDDKIELVKEPVDLYDLFVDVLTICNIKARDNGISLYHDNGVNLMYRDVIGSELHLKRLFMNIVNNCVKYNKASGEIFCNEFLVSADEDTVVYRFEISDTGIGMSEKFLAQIFDPFTQERNDARSRYQGTGMGMAIVKKLIDKMNGTIEVESTVGVGSKFIITIPFEINKNPQNHDEEYEEDNTSIEGMRILLVEDNELNTEIAKFILEDAGAVITVAKDGQIAYDTFYNHPSGSFDIILMDIMMPVLDGYGATEKIRKSDKDDAESIPILAMTANAFAEDVKKAKEAGMDGHIAKPFRVDLLLKMIKKYVKQ